MLRSFVGESARTVAETAGLAHSLVPFIENGERLDPRASTVLALGRIFGVSAEWLVDGEGELPTQEAVIAAFEKARGSQATEALSQ